MARLPHVIPSLDEVQVDIRGAIAIVRLCRPKKRNAINDGLIAAIAQRFDELPETVHAVVLHGEGDHFCAGLDLGELKDRDAAEGLHHSRSWYYVLRDIEQGRRPVVAALHGAVVGGGLELATACHIRVADDSTFFALPEGSRGIFVGGGGSVRVPKLIGAHRMLDMMLTGRVYKAAEGVSIGMAQYHVPAGEALAKAIELAERIAQNAPMTNYALINGLPRIAEQPADHGFLTESLLAGIAQAAPEAKARVRAFLDGTGPKVKA
ncbi:MAG: crotonase/enoyl-CoA hydratase family protein [Ramlibacter sp.]|jgi:enoyl-CoA hydratase/carnithine racemase|uniref:crotonase/enoyl-CoA hydratase family protein n=1 Tax=Ramlibacter sp. TaxID=1917967 RepID=UPI00260C53EA|nr:crotonase/enoyl-CoA hydratase family protein [Ramlibacter sp.]MDH4376957.1 crotonase/enoyl-CoA hydratase family protein [Ramlibacter sp.]